MGKLWVVFNVYFPNSNILYYFAKFKNMFEHDYT